MNDIMNRRRHLQRLGLVVGAAYVGPLVLNISDARAASGPSGGGDSGGGGGGGSSGPDTASAPSAPSNPSAPSTPSSPSGANESGASLSSNRSCSDVLGRSVSCN
jgi:hypothetical protein